MRRFAVFFLGLICFAATDPAWIADKGGISVPDAKGLETLLRGIKGTARGDDDLAREASKVFDHFYSAYAQTSAGKPSSVPPV